MITCFKFWVCFIYIFYSFNILAKYNFESNLPLIHIQTKKGKMIGRVNKADGYLTLLNNQSRSNHTSDLFNLNPKHAIKIRMRGNSSLYFKKKQYKLEFVDFSNPEEDVDVEFLGLSKDSTWVLNGPYADKSMMRNALAYWTSRDLIDHEGKSYYAPRTKFFELFINYRYKGVYVLIEKIGRGKNKVPIRKMKAEDADQIDFIVQLNGKDDFGKYFQTQKKTYVSYVYPKNKKIIGLAQENPVAAQKIRTNIQQAVNELEQSICDGRIDLFDHQSFANFFLLQEVFKNVDGFRRSFFFHRRKNGKFYFGPVWDFNIAMGNLWFYNETNPKDWQNGYGKYIDSNKEVFWIQKLLKHPTLVRKIVSNYQNYRMENGPLATETILSKIDQMASDLQMPAKRNFRRWRLLGLPRPFLVFAPPPWSRTYGGEVNKLKNFMIKRLNWLDKAMPRLLKKAERNFQMREKLNSI